MGATSPLARRTGCPSFRCRSSTPEVRQLKWDSGKLNGGANDTATNTFSVRVPTSLASATFYDWTAKVWNTKGEYTPWSDKLPMRETTNPPSLSAPSPVGKSYGTLDGVTFQATYSDPGGRGPGRPACRCRSGLLPLQATLSGTATTHLWDSGLTRYSGGSYPSPTLVRVRYGGKALAAGAYSWRMRAADDYDATSTWVYGTFTLTKGYEVEPGSEEYLTGYDQQQDVPHPHLRDGHEPGTGCADGGNLRRRQRGGKRVPQQPG